MKNSKKEAQTMEIGNIRNRYGCQEVKQEEGKYYWSIENWDGHHWDEIPKYLYDNLVKYEKERDVR